MNLNQRIINIENELKSVINEIRDMKYVAKDTKSYVGDVERKVELLVEIVDNRTV